LKIVRGVEVELETALEKLRAANKDLAKGIRELNKAIAADQQELKKYVPGEDCLCLR
jgi:soluble cytochrome b562